MQNGELMPLYVFACGAGHRTEELRPASKFRRKRRCGTCKRMATIDITAQMPAVHGDLKPFWSESLGVGELDVRHPDEHYDKLGRMYIRGRGHLREMQQRYGLASRRSYTGNP